MIYIPVIVAVIILILAAAYEVYVKISEGFVNAGIMTEYFSKYTVLKTPLSYVILFVYFGLPITGVFLAYLVGSDKIFLIPGIVLLLIGVFINMIIKDVMIELIQQFPSALSIFQTTPFSQMLAYFPLIMFIFGIILLIAQHSKTAVYV